LSLRCLHASHAYLSEAHVDLWQTAVRAKPNRGRSRVREHACVFMQKVHVHTWQSVNRMPYRPYMHASRTHVLNPASH